MKDRPLIAGGAVYLGVWAAAVGWWRGRVFAGLAALAGGALVTMLALAPPLARLILGPPRTTASPSAPAPG